MFSKLEPPDGLYAPLVLFRLNRALSPVKAASRVSNSRSKLHPPRLWFPLIVHGAASASVFAVCDLIEGS
jgi:hypothetical protein